MLVCALKVIFNSVASGQAPELMAVHHDNLPPGQGQAASLVLFCVGEPDRSGAQTPAEHQG